MYHVRQNDVKKPLSFFTTLYNGFIVDLTGFWCGILLMAKSEQSLKLPFPKPPFDEFIEERLKGFEEHLQRERLRPSSIEQRMRGAREFATYLIGRPHRFRQQTKGKI